MCLLTGNQGGWTLQVALSPLGVEPHFTRVISGTLVALSPSPGLPCPPTAVGAERSGATGISSPSIWSHHGCIGQPPLAASVSKDYFQDRRADLSGYPWRCPAVPTAVYTDRRHSVSTKTAVFFIWRSTRSSCETAYNWTPCLLCRRRSHTERPTGRRHLSTISAYLQKTSKTASVSTLVAWPSLIN